MPRAVWLVVALLLALPAVLAGWTLLASVAFIAEFLSGGRAHPLSAITQPPVIRPLGGSRTGPALAADLYVSPSFRRPSGLVLVHGITARGKEDPQLGKAAALLARAGWAVAVPTVDGLTALRLRPADADTVAGAIRALRDTGYGPVALLGVSLGSAPTLSAAGEPDLAATVSAILTLGGYASARELLRYTLTGAYAFDGIRGRRPVDEGGIARFARANGELVDAGGQALVGNRDPGSVDALIAALPDRTQRLLDALSPERAVARLRAPLFLIHGRDDPAVPFTESLRLARAARASGGRVTVAIVGAVGHVDPEERATAREILRAWATFYAFSVVSSVPPR